MFINNQEVHLAQERSITILRLPTVKNRTGLSRSNIYLKVAKGEFPQPVSLGERCIGWVEEEITHWIEQRVQASRGCKGGTDV